MTRLAHEYDNEDVKSVILGSQSNCDPARKLRQVLDALVDANLQEADVDDNDEEYERRAAAKTFLFKLATALTNGFRDKKDEIG